MAHRRRSGGFPQGGGFTLVELVIVIAIIGILAAVAIPRFIDIRTEAYVAQREGIVSSVRTGVLLVASKNQVQDNPSPGGTFPPNLEADWGGIVAGGTLAADGTACSVNNCFELVLSTPITDSRWTQTTSTTYTFAPPPGSGSPKTYTYDSTNGTFK